MNFIRKSVRAVCVVGKVSLVQDFLWLLLVSPVSIISTVLHASISFICRRRYKTLAIDNVVKKNTFPYSLGNINVISG